MLRRFETEFVAYAEICRAFPLVNSSVQRPCPDSHMYLLQLVGVESDGKEGGRSNSVC